MVSVIKTPRRGQNATRLEDAIYGISMRTQLSTLTIFVPDHQGAYRYGRLRGVDEQKIGAQEPHRRDRRRFYITTALRQIGVVVQSSATREHGALLFLFRSPKNRRPLASIMCMYVSYLD